MDKHLLPVGSVVLLEEAEKKLLIIGNYVKKADDDRVYDYVGVPYPEGYIGGETMFLFFQEDIKQVVFLGYIDKDMQIFRAKVEAKMTAK